nr:CD225/dispanin family protein [Mycobacterium uberis]
MCTVLRCLVFRIVSITYSTKASGLWSNGHYTKSQVISNNAKR